MRKVLNGCAWVFAIFCFLAALVYGFSIISGIMLFVGIFALPIKPIRNIWKNMFGKTATAIRIAGLAIMFCVGACAAPQTEVAPNTAQTIEMESSIIEIESTLAEIESTAETVQMLESSVDIIEQSVEENDNNESVIESETEPVTDNSEIETESIVIPVTASEEKKTADLGTLKVHFINIGQGDCTLIENNGEYMLIDAGENDKGTLIQNYLKKQGVKDLKYFIVTHDDSDHEGGADVVITKFNIENVFMCAFKKDTKTHNDVLNALKAKSMKWSTPKTGDTYTVGNATFTILAPNKTYNNPNDSSIALLLSFGEKKFIFTGDCEENAEADILRNGINIDADVYQVGHHGSNTSSSQRFLDKVTPEYAVISCGEGNSYGHPRAETLNKFRTMGINVFRTDEQGTLVCECDGKELTWNSSPSTTWKAGEPTENSNNTEKQTKNEKNAKSDSLAEKKDNSTSTVTKAITNNEESKQEIAVEQEPEPIVDSVSEPQLEPAVVEPTPTPSQGSDIMVWLSATGEKYHSIDHCGRMNPSKARQVTEAQAIAQGKGKCSKCW